MSKVYFVYQIDFDANNKIVKNRLGGPFSSPFETDEKVEEYIRMGYDKEDLAVESFDEDNYYYGKNK